MLTDNLCPVPPRRCAAQLQRFDSRVWATPVFRKRIPPIKHPGSREVLKLMQTEASGTGTCAFDEQLIDATVSHVCFPQSSDRASTPRKPESPWPKASGCRLRVQLRVPAPEARLACAEARPRKSSGSLSRGSVAVGETAPRSTVRRAARRERKGSRGRGEGRDGSAHVPRPQRAERGGGPALLGPHGPPGAGEAWPRR